MGLLESILQRRRHKQSESINRFDQLLTRAVDAQLDESELAELDDLALSAGRSPEEITAEVARRKRIKELDAKLAELPLLHQENIRASEQWTEIYEKRERLTAPLDSEMRRLSQAGKAIDIRIGALQKLVEERKSLEPKPIAPPPPRIQAADEAVAELNLEEGLKKKADDALRLALSKNKKSAPPGGLMPYHAGGASLAELTDNSKKMVSSGEQLRLGEDAPIHIVDGADQYHAEDLARKIRPA